MESMVRHRCPLIDPAIGITPETVLCMDALHTLYLGPIHSWVVFTTWSLFRARAFGPYDAGVPHQLALACLTFKHELHRWYRERARIFPTERLTRLGTVDPKTVGTHNAMRFKAKAAEAYGVMLFLLSELRRHLDDVPLCRDLLDGGLALEHMVGIMKDNGPVLSAPVLEDLWRKRDVRRCVRVRVCTCVCGVCAHTNTCIYTCARACTYDQI